MARAVKVAISLPGETLAAIDQAASARNQTRSDFLRQAAETYLRQLEIRASEERYVAGYQAQPETAQETRDAAGFLAAAAEVMGADRWE